MTWSPFRDAKTRAAWRELLMREQNGLCGLCGHRIPDFPVAGDPRYSGFEASFDHIVPRAHGGEDALHNLRLVHRCCNHIRGDADGLSRIPPIPRRLRAEPPRLPPRVRINREGEAWCHNRDWKRCYPTLTSAWLVAFRSFVETGRVHTPYWCGRSRFTRAIGRYRIGVNPWRFDPFIFWVGSFKRHARGCGLWHLKSHPNHILTTELQLALPKAMGWEAYHRAPDGSWVRRDRECMRPDGLAKKQFESREHAVRCARSIANKD